MKEIKFTTGYEDVLPFNDKNFKAKYEERTGKNPAYTTKINGEIKHLAVCPRCDNPVIILGIYKRINISPHARHIKNTDIPGITSYDEYKYLNCPYHKKNASYVMEYVSETEGEKRRELYKIAKENFDKAIYVLQKETGIYVNKDLAEKLIKNYAELRAYNYIDATVYNMPCFLLHAYNGIPLHHMLVKKDSIVHKHIKNLDITLKKSKLAGYEYVLDNNGYVLNATDYKYSVGRDDRLREWLHFSIIKPDENITNTLLYVPVHRFLVEIDPYYFGNLVYYKNWKKQDDLLNIANKYMK